MGDNYYYYYYIATAIELCPLFVEHATLQVPLHPQVKEKPTRLGSYVRVIFGVFLECCTLI